MRRALLPLCLPAAALGGCYADYYATTPSGGYVAASVPVGAPGAISVSVAPPPLRYEPFLHCGYGQTYIRGHWDWNGAWYWVPGRCVGTLSGYVYVPPSYSGGVYVRGHWALAGGGYVPPPAPAYRAPAPQPYVPPPQPGYAPAPQPYVPPPQPGYAPAPQPYVPPPQPGYAPAPQPYVPPPAPAYRSVPAPGPAPTRVGVPPPAPAR